MNAELWASGPYILQLWIKSETMWKFGVAFFSQTIFLSKKSTLITESESESEFEFESESEHEPHLESESEFVEFEKAKSKEKSQHELERGSKLTLLQIPNFIEHYQQVIQENL